MASPEPYVYSESPMDSPSQCPSPSEVNDIWNVMQNCALCSKEMTSDSSPQLLQCCHSACKACVHQQLAAQCESDPETRTVNQDINENSNGKSTCKICNEKFSPSECIDNIFQLYHYHLTLQKSTDQSISTQNNDKQLEKKCRSCDDDGANRDVYIKCNVCDWICYNCFESHNKMKIFKGHIMDANTKIKPKNITDSEFNETYLKCIKHNGELILYCVQCETPICVTCLIDGHIKHEYEKDLEPLINDFRVKTKDMLSNIGEKRSFIETALNSIDALEEQINEQENKVTEDIKIIAKKLQDQISELANARLDYVHELCQKKKFQCNEKGTQLKQFNAALNHLEKFVKVAVFQQELPVAIMKGRKLIQHQLNHLLTKPCLNQSNLITQFTVKTEDIFEQSNVKSSMPQMLDYMFNTCCKIITSDDKERNNENESDKSNSPVLLHIPSSTGIVSLPQSPATTSLSGHVISNSGTIRGSVYVPCASMSHPPAYNSPHTPAHSSPKQQTPLYTNTHCQMPTLKPHNNSQILQQNQTSQIPMPSLTNATMHGQTVSGERVISHLEGMLHIHCQTCSMQKENMNYIPQTGVVPPVHSQTNVGINYQSRPMVSQSNHMIPQLSLRMENINSTVNHRNYTNMAHVRTKTSIQRAPIQNQMQTSKQFFSTAGAEYYGSTNVEVVPQSSILGTTVQQHRVPHYVQQQSSINNLKTYSSVTHNRSSGRTRVQPMNCQSIINSRPLAGGSALNTPRVTIVNTSTSSSSITNPNRPLLPREVSPQSSQLRNMNPQTTTTPIVQTTCNKQQLKKSENVQQLVINHRSDAQQTPQSNKTEMPVIRQLSDPVASSKTSRITANEPLLQTKQLPVTQTTVINNSKKNAKKTMSVNGPISTLNYISFNKSKQLFTIVNNTQKGTAEVTSVETTEKSNLHKEKDNSKESESIDITDNKEIEEIATQQKKVATITPLVSENVDTDQQFPDNDSDDDTDDNDDWCSVCRNGGELLCCENCPKAFHIDCHVPILDKVPANAWSCTFCRDIDKLSMETPRKKRKNIISMNERQHVICERILLELMCYEQSLKLHHHKNFIPKPIDTPVSSKNAMDLSMIREKLSSRNGDNYEDESEFITDIMRVFDNCVKNKTIDDDDLIKVKTELKSLVENYLPDFKNKIEGTVKKDVLRPSSTKIMKN